MYVHKIILISTPTITAIENTDRSIGIKDLAKIANVSIGTIDRVLHNRPGVSKATRERVLAIIQAHEYKPNLLAKHLASKKQFRIAILMPHQNENPVWVPYAKGTERARRDAEKFAVEVDTLFFSQYDKGSFDEVAAKASTYDALMLVPIFEESAAHIANQFAAQGKICLCFDTNFGTPTESLFIGQDAFQAGRLSASVLDYSVPKDKSILLINLGRKEGYHFNFWGREKGFRAFFQDKKAPPHKLLAYEGSIKNSDHLEKGITEILQSHPEIGGIFVANSRVHWVAHIMEQIDRPDLRVLGFDLIPQNIQYLKTGHIDFLIYQRPEDQGYRGVEWLMQKLVFGEPDREPGRMPIDVILKENLGGLSYN